MTSLECLPTDLHHLIFAHASEEKRLKEENEKLKEIIDDFAKYTSLSTSRPQRNIFFDETVSLFGPPSETPNIRVLGDTLFAKMKALDPTVDRNSYMLWTRDEIESEIIGTESTPISDMWCIADLRDDLSIYELRAARPLAEN